MDQRKSDRRSATRFEPMDPMWGTVGLTREWALRNIGRGGVQIESPCSLPQNSAHLLVLPFLRNATVTARVRYSTPAEEPSGLRVFHVGLEFVAPSPEVVDEIDKLVASMLSGT